MNKKMELMDSSTIFSIIPLILFIFFLFNKLYSSCKHPKLNLPPSPPKLPIIGNLHQLGTFPHRSLQKLSAKYGPMMLIYLGKKPALVVTSADAAREIMKTHDLIFSNRPKLSTADRLLYGSKDVAFSPYGDSWRQLRSICVLQLLSNKRVRSFRDVREEETTLMIENIYRKLSSPSSLLNLSEVFVDLTNDIICRVALGKKYGKEKDGKNVKVKMAEFIALMRDFCLSDYVPWLGWVDRLNGIHERLEKIAKEIDNFLEKVIEEHKKKEKVTQSQHHLGNVTDDQNSDEARNSDFVDILLELQMQNVANFPVERDTLKALILDMFVAGTDTTHTVMVWAMAELLRHPKVMDKLQIEIRKQGNSGINEDVVGKFCYLKAVIKETLRLHAPVPLLVPRESTQDVRVKGYDISADTQVIINAWAIGRDQRLWDQPEEFIPERFLVDSNIDFQSVNNFEMIPFGAGRRGCPGINFAMAVNELALAKLLNAFDFQCQEELDMAESTGVTVNKKSSLYVIATPHYSC
ncbi:OLC1v1013288C1 [Oldenlandia corymbosa var. corymbosa]|uniref:OLC1v1013288C1 n=1 Tax=Oldenlandia corymbosa var. corymbosa TaxID=529605 RepID=A0AAV1E162_OLDCO|nr:OLC1v1013288C1 [Oldenlandia corymbosa var. corymbosa]